MKYQAIIKYCPVTASQKGWEVVLGEFDTEDEVKEFLDKNAERLMPPMSFGGNRMLFMIKGVKDGNNEKGRNS